MNPSEVQKKPVWRGLPPLVVAGFAFLFDWIDFIGGGVSYSQNELEDLPLCRG